MFWNQWYEFCKYIRHQNRFILNKKWQGYINQILRISERKYFVMKKGSLLYRARIGSKRDKSGNPQPFLKKDIGAPSIKKSIAGRINPKGISCLYLSGDRGTAIAEVRPWLSEHVTVGIFMTKLDLKLTDLSKGECPPLLGFTYREENDLDGAEKEIITLGHIGYAFSKPVSQGDPAVEYLPTQFLAESFKNAGYDGILYKSSLTRQGKNAAIFNPKHAEVKEAHIVRINEIKYEHVMISNRISYD